MLLSMTSIVTAVAFFIQALFFIAVLGQNAVPDRCDVSREWTDSDCGPFGIMSRPHCMMRGCCWKPCDDCLPGTSWCIKSREMYRPECAQKPEAKKHCGYEGIERRECLLKQCCWVPSNFPNDTSWCYHPNYNISPSIIAPQPVIQNSNIPAPVIQTSNLTREDGCVLPLHPDEVCFGSEAHSRIELDRLPTSIRSLSEFSLEFKTSERDGVLLYIADNEESDFIAVHMRSGKLVFSFNCGDSTAVLTSVRKFNNNQWHKGFFFRRRRRGHMTVDYILEAEGRVGGRSKYVNIAVPLYIGGLPEETTAKTQQNLMGVTSGFKGCIRNLRLNQAELVQPNTSENGRFFHPEGGYIKLADSFRIRSHLELTMDIKPRRLSGVLLSASSGEDYFVLQIVDGEVMCSFNSTGRERILSLKLARNSALCDGEWHRVKVLKTENGTTLWVDQTTASFKTENIGTSSRGSHEPVYIGGAPVVYHGMKTSTQYVGCIRNVTLNGKQQDISRGIVNGRVTHVCPTS